MKVKVEQMLGVKDCPYTFRGENLAQLRRARLFRVAQAFDLGDPAASKNQLLTNLIAKLRMMNAETEITDMVED